MSVHRHLSLDLYAEDHAALVEALKHFAVTFSESPGPALITGEAKWSGERFSWRSTWRNVDNPGKPPPRFQKGDRVRIWRLDDSFTSKTLIGKECVVDEVDDIVIGDHRLQVNYTIVSAGGGEHHHYMHEGELEPGSASEGEVIVHHLAQGRTPCGMRQLPADWAPGHLWTDKWRDVQGCRGCLAAKEMVCPECGKDHSEPELVGTKLLACVCGWVRP
jgi:hypothetical protein